MPPWLADLTTAPQPRQRSSDMDAATVVELELLRELAGRLKDAGHRERGAIMLDATARLGKSKATLYARLKAAGLYDAASSVATPASCR